MLFSNKNPKELFDFINELGCDYELKEGSLSYVFIFRDVNTCLNIKDKAINNGFICSGNGYGNGLCFKKNEFTIQHKIHHDKIWNLIKPA